MNDLATIPNVAGFDFIGVTICGKHIPLTVYRHARGYFTVGPIFAALIGWLPVKN